IFYALPIRELVRGAGDAPRAPAQSAALPAAVGPKYEGPLSFEGIRAFMRDNGIQSEDALLSSLPERLRSNFTLMRQSRALHRDCVSDELPRAILFSPADRFVLAFNARRDRPECRVIEMLELIPNEDRIAMR